jgi:hypothetical protein
MKSVFAFEALLNQIFSLFPDSIRLMCMDCSMRPPLEDHHLSLFKGVHRVLEVKDIGPCELNPTFHDLLLNPKLGFRVKPNTQLILVIEGTIEAAIIKIYSHIVLCKKESCEPWILLDLTPAQRPSSPAAMERSGIAVRWSALFGHFAV